MGSQATRCECIEPDLPAQGFSAPSSGKGNCRPLESESGRDIVCAVLSLSEHMSLGEPNGLRSAFSNGYYIGPLATFMLSLGGLGKLAEA